MTTIATRITAILGAALLAAGTGLAVMPAAASAAAVHFAGYSTGPGTPVASTPQGAIAAAANSVYTYNLNGEYLNGSGSSCSNNAWIVGWGAGQHPNEIFNTYVDPSGQYWMFQAHWCANNGTSGSGKCIWDNSTGNHGLELYSCNPGSSIDFFYFQLNNGMGIYQFINRYWGKYVNCTGTDGQQCWDGGYTRYAADWKFLGA